MALTPVTQLDIDTFNADMRTLYATPTLYFARVKQVLVDDTQLTNLQTDIGNLLTLDEFRNLVILASTDYADTTTARATTAELQARQVIQSVNADRIRAEQKYQGLVQRISTAINYEV